ncbi:hypothetical protein L596_026477 [Steinernema carpocapsae]|uniref:Uncharacterized protein n=1 Tax=Steinernema carpocapsae TaxID=34508 RepID=A0A4U5M1H0_STECR|nr:hypothetical protein L596_026477 [Steinernema carpocapsae]
MDTVPFKFLDAVIRMNSCNLDADDFTGNWAKAIQNVEENFVNLFIEVFVTSDLTKFFYTVNAHGDIRGVQYEDLTLEEIKPFKKVAHMKHGSWNDPDFLRLVMQSVLFPEVAFGSEAIGCGLQFYEKLLEKRFRPIDELQGTVSQDPTTVDILRKDQFSGFFQTITMPSTFTDPELTQIIDLFFTSRAMYLNLVTNSVTVDSLLLLLRSWEAFEGEVGFPDKRMMPDGNYETIEKLLPDLEHKCHVRKFDVDEDPEMPAFEIKLTQVSKKGIVFKPFDCPFVCEVHFVEF